MALLIISGKVTFFVVFHSFSSIDDVSGEGDLIVAATFHPFATKYFAVAAPMPLEAPVIKTVLLIFDITSRNLDVDIKQHKLWSILHSQDRGEVVDGEMTYWQNCDRLKRFEGEQVHCLIK
jgi:hypothetical protein